MEYVYKRRGCSFALFSFGLCLINVGIGSKGSDKCFLWDFNAANHLHPLLTLFLFVEELALTRDISAVTFSENIFADGANTFTGDNATADGGLNRNFELL